MWASAQEFVALYWHHDSLASLLQDMRYQERLPFPSYN